MGELWGTLSDSPKEPVMMWTLSGSLASCPTCSASLHPSQTGHTVTLGSPRHLSFSPQHRLFPLARTPFHTLHIWSAYLRSVLPSSAEVHPPAGHLWAPTLPSRPTKSLAHWVGTRFTHQSPNSEPMSHSPLILRRQHQPACLLREMKVSMRLEPKSHNSQHPPP